MHNKYYLNRTITSVLQGVKAKMSSSIEELAPGILGTRVDSLPAKVIRDLGLQLFNEVRGISGNWESVAEELGISTTRELELIKRHANLEQKFPGMLMLDEWSKKGGSTVFVLLNALRKQGREECIDIVVRACEELDTMHLNVQIQDITGKITFKSISTKRTASLGSSLENELCGLRHYFITGPDSRITWDTQATHLKGVMLSVKQAESTELTYGEIGAQPIDSAMFVQDTHVLPPNIPVTDASLLSGTSNNISVTSAKYLASVENQNNYYQDENIYNDLSQRMITQSTSPQIEPILPQLRHTQSSPIMISPRQPRPESQTLLKEVPVPSSQDHTGNYLSHTPPKECFLTEFHSQTDFTCKAEHTHQRLALRPKPVTHVIGGSPYIQHDGHVRSFSNPTSNCGSLVSAASPASVRKPIPCIMNIDYVSHDVMTDTGGTPQLTARPVACILQQRTDGYVDMIERDKLDRLLKTSQSVPHLRQFSEPVTLPRAGVVNPDRSKIMYDNPRPPPCKLGKTIDADSMCVAHSGIYVNSPSTSSRCMLSRGVDGYSKYVCSGSMDIDSDTYSISSTKGSNGDSSLEENAKLNPNYFEGNINSTPPTQTDNTFDMECDSVYVNQLMENQVPTVIQQSSNGYFGFTSAKPIHPCTVTSPSTGIHKQEYVDMSRSHNVPDIPPSYGSFSTQLVYAGLDVGEDEEEDAVDLPIVKQASPEMEYSDIVPDVESQYDYSGDVEFNKMRKLPPRPSAPPVPMTRMRNRPQEQSTSATETSARRHSDLDTMPGWCANETEQSISTSMAAYTREDGNFIVWWMCTKCRYVITVSHMNCLHHYAVYQRVHGGQERHFLFPGGEEFHSLTGLVQYYMKEGLKGPATPSSESRGKRWQQFSHVQLKMPLKIKYKHKAVRKN